MIDGCAQDHAAAVLHRLSYLAEFKQAIDEGVVDKYYIKSFPFRWFEVWRLFAGPIPETSQPVIGVFRVCDIEGGDAASCNPN